jgi:hypothetical protein
MERSWLGCVLVIGLIAIPACREKPDFLPLAPDLGVVHFPTSSWVVFGAMDRGQTLTSPNSQAPQQKVTTGRFIEVHYEVTNTGKDQVVLEYPQKVPKIVDGSRNVLGPIDNESAYLPPTSKTATGNIKLEPHSPVELWTIIEVPKDVTGAKVSVSDVWNPMSAKEFDLPMFPAHPASVAKPAGSACNCISGDPLCNCH